MKKKVAYLVPTIPCARNTTRFQRILHLSQHFELTVLHRDPWVPEELRSRARFHCPPTWAPSARHLNTLFFTLWSLHRVSELRRQGLRTVVTSSHYFTSVVGLISKLRMGTTWVADIYDVPKLAQEVTEILEARDLVVQLPIALAQDALLKGIFRRADLVLCTLVPDALQEYRIPTNKLLPLTNGVDPDSLVSSTPPSEPADGFRVLYLVGLSRIRGVDMLLESAEALMAQCPDVRWIIAGPASSKELRWFNNAVETKGLRAQLDYVGELPHSEALRLVASADVCLFLFPKTFATDPIYPIKVLEYMAHGKPIVATSLAGIRRILTDGSSAALIPPGDSRALSIAIRALRDNPLLRERLGKNALMVAKEYDWKTINDRVVQAVEKIST